MGFFSKLATVSSILVATDARRHLDDKDIAAKRRPVENAIQNENVKEATGVVMSPLVKASECEEMCFFNQ